jgi:hypothetical protein
LPGCRRATAHASPEAGRKRAARPRRPDRGRALKLPRAPSITGRCPSVTFHVTDTEYSELQARAADAGLHLRSYVRAELFRDGPQPGDLTSELQDHEQRIARLEELVVAFGLSA